MKCSKDQLKYSIWSKFFKVYQNFVTMSLFFIFLFSTFLPCKDTFMNDYDGIWNCNGLKYNLFEIFDNF